MCGAVFGDWHLVFGYIENGLWFFFIFQNTKCKMLNAIKLQFIVCNTYGSNNYSKTEKWRYTE